MTRDGRVSSAEFVAALRNVARSQPSLADLKSTPSEPEMEADPERFRLYRLCPCSECNTTGRVLGMSVHKRCPSCRGEGRTLDLVATCPSPEAVGVALVTLGREGEWHECPVGVLDSAGAKNEKWIVSPWLPSARNVSDAGRTLARSKTTRPS